MIASKGRIRFETRGVRICVSPAFDCSPVTTVARKRPPRARNEGLSPEAKRQAQRIQSLSKTQQRFVVQIIDALELGNLARK